MCLLCDPPCPAGDIVAHLDVVHQQPVEFLADGSPVVIDATRRRGLLRRA